MSFPPSPFLILLPFLSSPFTSIDFPLLPYLPLPSSRTSPCCCLSSSSSLPSHRLQAWPAAVPARSPKEHASPPPPRPVGITLYRENDFGLRMGSIKHPRGRRDVFPVTRHAGIQKVTHGKANLGRERGTHSTREADRLVCFGYECVCCDETRAKGAVDEDEQARKKQE